MRRNLAGRTLATLTLGAMLAPAAIAAADEPTAKDKETSRDRHERRMVIKIVSSDGTLTVKQEDGDRDVYLNGEKLDVSRTTWDGEEGVYRIYKDDEVVFEANLKSPPRFLRFGAHGEREKKHAEHKSHGERKEGEHERAMLGVAPRPLGPALASQLGLDRGRAVLIGRVIPGSAADRAGIKHHDVIVEIDGQSPVTPRRLRRIIGSKKPGQTVELKILRRGERTKIDVELGAMRGGDDDAYERDRAPGWMRGFDRHMTREMLEKLREHGVFESLDQLKDDERLQKLQKRLQKDWSETLKMMRKSMEDFDFDPDDLPEIEVFRNNGDGVLLFGRRHKDKDESHHDHGRERNETHGRDHREDADDRRRMMGRMMERMQQRRERMQTRLERIEQRLERLENVLRRLEKRLERDQEQPNRDAAVRT